MQIRRRSMSASAAQLLSALCAALVSAQTAGAAIVHDRVQPPHTFPTTCATCRYVTVKADGPQQYRMTRAGTVPPAKTNPADEYVLLVDGTGHVSQFLTYDKSWRARDSEILAAISNSGAKFCDFTSAADKDMAVEYYEPGHRIQSIDDAGISLTQAYPVAVKKNGTFYVFRNGESVACGTPNNPVIAAKLFDAGAGVKPGFKQFIQEQVAAGLRKYFEIPEVPEPELPLSPILVKDEFEKSAAFNRRVDIERNKREEAIYKQQQEFRRKVEQRNKLIETRQASRDAYTDQLTRQATLDALGRVMLRNPEYDADAELMYADIVSTKTDFSRRIAFQVPTDNDQARNLKTRIADAEITLRLDVVRDGIAVRDAAVALDGSSYPGGVAKTGAQTLAVQSIDLRNLDGRAASYTRPAQLQSPDLVDRRILHYDDGSIEDDVRGPVSNMRTAATDKTKWLFAIAVENYANTDPVLYAKNSGELVVAAFQKKFGISPRNTYALIDGEATAGAFKDKLATMLGNVQPGDTVYFYYSGHGIPDQKSDESYILPRDKMVGFVANEDYLRLSKIYKQLEASSAAKIYAFVDSCFSGKTDNVSNFKGVAPGVFRTHDLVVDKERMVVITAGKSNQFSNAYPERGHRMFSYFLLKSLTKRRPDAAQVNVQEIFQEISVGVRDASSAKGDAYLQEPQLAGNANARF